MATVKIEVPDDEAVPKMYRWRIGYWLSEKKLKKLNFDELAYIAKSADIELVQIDLDDDLEIQGPYDAIFHKLSDFIVLSDRGDSHALRLVRKVEQFLSNHPDIVVLDPFHCVRRLCDRYQQYSLVQEVCETDNVYTPAFVELTNKDLEENATKLRSAGVQYPFVCKPLVAHGSDHAHQMSIIFCEAGLKDVEPPCVAQTFICHNAVLYKVFVVGDKYYVVPRPSLKNFKSQYRDTIFFDSHAVSKEGCSSDLSELDEEDKLLPAPPLVDERIAAVVRDMRQKTEISLFGLDVIVETGTGFHFIIDVNTFPSYDGVPNFYGAFVELMTNSLKANEEKLTMVRRNRRCLKPVPNLLMGQMQPKPLRNATKSVSECLLDSGIGSCTESDNSDCERKLLKLKALRLQQSRMGDGVASSSAATPKAPKTYNDKFATISTPMAAYAEHAQPNWSRIKRFYGIPKPPSKPRLP